MVSNINCEENFQSWNPKTKVGHSYKLCPYSEQYYTNWNLTGSNTPNPEDPRGNSRTYPYGASHPAGAPHNTTGGGMILKSRGNITGFMCTDPNCPKFTITGVRYFES